MEKEIQGFYYIIPAPLAESGKPIKALLYGLITSLTRNTGKCTASNEYLGKKLKRKSQGHISEWLKELAQEGWIKISIDQKKGNQREIILGHTPLTERGKTSYRKREHPSYRKREASNITNSNINKYSTETGVSGIDWIYLQGKKEVKTKGGLQEINEYKIADLWKKNINFYESQGVSPENTPLRQGVSRATIKGYHQMTTNNNPINKNPINTQTEKQISEVIYSFQNLNPMYVKWYQRKPVRQKCQDLIEAFGVEEVKNAIKFCEKIISDQYAPVITTPEQLERKWGALQAYYLKESRKSNKSKIETI